MELSPSNYDFAGWATRSNQLCSDGRTIRPDAFKHHDGEIVPLIWGHKHDDPFAVLGKALLHSVDGDIYAYCAFNDTESGNTAKELVKHGDVCSLSICANQLKHDSKRGVMHGMIRELSLVVAGANPKARIETVKLAHSIDGDEYDDEIHVYNEETITLFHADNIEKEKEEKKVAEETKKPEPKKEENDGDETVADVFETLTDKQKKAVYAIVGSIVGPEEDDDDDEEGGNEMKHNVFDQEDVKQDSVLTHADQEAIISLAKQSSVGSLKQAMAIYAEENDNDTLAHGIFENYGELFPEYELLKKGEPETFLNDQSWISNVLSKVHKSPFSRIRTRYADARIAELKAKGYQNKGDEKKKMAQIKLLGRTFDPQTIYIKDDMHRDDIIDVKDFDIVAYQWKMMRTILNETLALAFLVGDGREDSDPDKIKEDHVCPVWHDDELYTMHHDVDIEAARTKLQGTNTGANFSDNYIYAEAIIEASLYAREKFKGTGTPDFYCTPHLVNVMLLARDLNGRRIYDSKADLAKALNVGTIHTVEQFEGLTRTTEDGDTKELLGLFVNLVDYQVGSTRGGEITKFEDFDMDFNKQKYLLETRLSAALNKPWAAIALEKPVTKAAG